MGFLKKKLAIISTIIGIVLIITFSYTYNRSTRSSAESGVQVSMNIIQKFFYQVGDSTSKFITFITSYKKLQRQVDYYKALSIENQRKVESYDELQSENDKLRILNDFQTKNESLKDRFDFLGAEIIGSNSNNTYLLSRGSKKGVSVGNVVVAYASDSESKTSIEVGLIGKVISVTTNSSIVQTILDQNMTVAAMIENRGDTLGALKGDYSVNNNFMTKLEMSSTVVASSVKKDFIVVTSGDGDIYPKGIKIGKIQKTEEDKASLSTISTVKPFVDFNNIDEVMIITFKGETQDYKGGTVN